MAQQTKDLVRIAIVGNGPLNRLDRLKIGQCEYVLRFNDTKNYQIGDPCHGLVLRVNATGVNGVDSEGRLISKINIGQLKDIYVLGNVKEESLDQLREHYVKKNIVLLKNINSEPGHSFSSGTRMIKYFLEQPKVQIHIFGMNWSGQSRWHNFELERKLMSEYNKKKIVQIHKTHKNNYLPY